MRRLESEDSWGGRERTSWAVREGLLNFSGILRGKN